jgi:hypothetical protein
MLIALGAIVEVLAILLWHQNLGQILKAVFTGGSVALVASIWPLLRTGNR